MVSASTGARPLFTPPELYFHFHSISPAVSALGRSMAQTLDESKKVLGSNYYSCSVQSYRTKLLSPRFITT